MLVQATVEGTRPRGGPLHWNAANRPTYQERNKGKTIRQTPGSRAVMQKRVFLETKRRRTMKQLIAQEQTASEKMQSGRWKQASNTATKPDSGCAEETCRWRLLFFPFYLIIRTCSSCSTSIVVYLNQMLSGRGQQEICAWRARWYREARRKRGPAGKRGAASRVLFTFALLIFFFWLLKGGWAGGGRGQSPALGH